MRRITALLVIASVFTITVSALLTAQPMDLEGDYFDAIASYYEVEIDDVKALAGDELSSTEVSVIYGIAQRSGIDAAKVASMFRENKSWVKVVGACELEAVDFYILVSGKITSKTFGPIFAKFSGMEPHLWKNLTLTDEEIIDMVNLRVLSSHHDYSLFDVMAMRDYGSSWARINQKVGLAKQALLDKLSKDTL